MTHHIFGIRHHGPGSARSLLQALEALRPDCVLVEGPPDADALLPLAAHAEMHPPVALLLYAVEQPRKAVYYPFATFSPEWQAIRFALHGNIPVRFMDLPQCHQLLDAASSAPVDLLPSELYAPPILLSDPLSELAKDAGYDDGERWWEHLVEHRSAESAEIFVAVQEAMAVLRETQAPQEPATPHTQHEAQREAHMRQTIRAAEKEGYRRIAVICGAWHAPALNDLATNTQADMDLLKSLPTVKVAATWVPWTFGRLTYASGYGAGIASPGWYQHLWEMGIPHPLPVTGTGSNVPETSDRITIYWLARVAHLLRQQGLDASSASVIETVRLAQTLAAIRGRQLPDLIEINEAIRSVLCFGDAAPMAVIHQQLIVHETLGAVPDEAPNVPLQQDVQREQKRLRMSLDTTLQPLELDLRKPTDLQRSQLLYRLDLLGVPWGKLVSTRSKGTFREIWQLAWQPEFVVRLIERAAWGNTVRDAAVGYAKARATGQIDNAPPSLPALSALLRQTLLAELPEALALILQRLQDEAAVANDLALLMDALPELANALRYGDVRRTDTALIRQVVSGFVTRICVGLAATCASLNDDAAAEMLPRINAVHDAVHLLDDAEMGQLWRSSLQQLALMRGLHGLLAGRVCRMLLDGRVLDQDAVARQMGLALSMANPPDQAAAWVEGFLGQSGLLLLHDEDLWNIVDGWVSQLTPEHFTQVLPLLRRTFTAFSAPERRQMGQRVAASTSPVAVAKPSLQVEIDHTRAEAALPLLLQLLGLNNQ